MRTIDLTGKTYERWTVIGPANMSDEKELFWNCVCSCGTRGQINGNSLRRGTSKSCGCLRTELTSLGGHYKTGTYNSWDNMIGRCYRRSQPDYENYGGRGITVCDRWRESFVNFLNDMGQRPEGLSIDRVNVNGNYEPGNCKWATDEEQACNRRNTVRYDYNGQSLTLKELSEAAGVSIGVLRNRRWAGLEDIKDITAPVKRIGRPKSLREGPYISPVREAAKERKQTLKERVASLRRDSPEMSLTAIARETGLSFVTVKTYLSEFGLS